VPDMMWRVFSATWQGVPNASFAVLVIGGLMYAAMFMSTRSANRTSERRAARRLGWIARRRARGSIVHRRDRVSVGYKSAVGTLHLTRRELTGHGAAFGPASGGCWAFASGGFESEAILILSTEIQTPRPLTFALAMAPLGRESITASPPSFVRMTVSA
jgi:hypothetical protein